MEKISAWFMQQEPARRKYLCDFAKICKKIHRADVLLIDGRSRASKIIKQVTQSPWSHAVLYIGHLRDIRDKALHDALKKKFGSNPNQQFVIETEIGKGTVISPIEIYKNDHIRILRPKWLTHDDAERVIAYALSTLGRRYNLRQLLDLARFLLPWGILPRKWRSSLFQRHALQPTEDICSSMIAEAFQSVRYPILPMIQEGDKSQLELVQRNPRLYTPSDFDYSPFFSVIKYPIFPLSGKKGYANLPWVEKSTSDL